MDDSNALILGVYEDQSSNYTATRTEVGSASDSSSYSATGPASLIEIGYSIETVQAFSSNNGSVVLDFVSIAENVQTALNVSALYTEITNGFDVGIGVLTGSLVITDTGAATDSVVANYIPFSQINDILFGNEFIANGAVFTGAALDGAVATDSLVSVPWFTSIISESGSAQEGASVTLSFAYGEVLSVSDGISMTLATQIQTAEAGSCQDWMIGNLVMAALSSFNVQAVDVTSGFQGSPNQTLEMGQLQETVSDSGYNSIMAEVGSLRETLILRHPGGAPVVSLPFRTINLKSVFHPLDCSTRK